MPLSFVGKRFIAALYPQKRKENGLEASSASTIDTNTLPQVAVMDISAPIFDDPEMFLHNYTAQDTASSRNNTTPVNALLEDELVALAIPDGDEAEDEDLSSKSSEDLSEDLRTRRIPTSRARLLALCNLSDKYGAFETISYKPWELHWRTIVVARDAADYKDGHTSNARAFLNQPLSPLRQVDISSDLYGDCITSTIGAEEDGNVSVSMFFPAVRGKKWAHAIHESHEQRYCFPQHGDVKAMRKARQEEYKLGTKFGKSIATRRREFILDLDGTRWSSRVVPEPALLNKAEQDKNRATMPGTNGGKDWQKWQKEEDEEAREEQKAHERKDSAIVVEKSRPVEKRESVEITETQNNDEIAVNDETADNNETVHKSKTVNDSSLVEGAPSIIIPTLSRDNAAALASRYQDLIWQDRLYPWNQDGTVDEPNQQLAAEIEKQVEKTTEARKRRRLERRKEYKKENVISWLDAILPSNIDASSPEQNVLFPDKSVLPP